MKFVWTKHQKIFKKLKNSPWMEETIDGYLLSDVMLLTILDGSHYKKSQQWLPWTYGSKYRRVQVENWPKPSGVWFLLQVSILDSETMVVISEIFGNSCINYRAVNAILSWKARLNVILSRTQSYWAVSYSSVHRWYLCADQPYSYLRSIDHQ